MAGYICCVFSDCIAERNNELSRLPLDKKADWRGVRVHITGVSLPVRWNTDLKIFEIELHETVKKHNIKAFANLQFPEDSWAPVQEYGKVFSDQIMEHYYGPRKPGTLEVLMSHHTARVARAYEKGFMKGRDEFLDMYVEKKPNEPKEPKEPASSWETSKLVEQELEKKQSTSSSGTWTKLEFVDYKDGLSLPQLARSSPIHDTPKAVTEQTVSQ